MKAYLFDLDGVEEVEFAGVGEVDYELAEEGVLPGEPGAGELARIILIEGLVHKSCAGIGLHQCLDAPLISLSSWDVNAFIIMLIGQM